MFAWLCEYESQLGTRKAWVLASSAEEAKRLLDSGEQIACFNSVQRYSAPRVLCYVE